MGKKTGWPTIGSGFFLRKKTTSTSILKIIIESFLFAYQYLYVAGAPKVDPAFKCRAVYVCVSTREARRKWVVVWEELNGNSICLANECVALVTLDCETHLNKSLAWKVWDYPSFTCKCAEDGKYGNASPTEPELAEVHREEVTDSNQLKLQLLNL